MNKNEETINTAILAVRPSMPRVTSEQYAKDICSVIKRVSKERGVPELNDVAVGLASDHIYAGGKITQLGLPGQAVQWAIDNTPKAGKKKVVAIKDQEEE